MNCIYVWNYVYMSGAKNVCLEVCMYVWNYICMSWAVCMSGIISACIELYVCLEYILELYMSVWNGLHKLWATFPSLIWSDFPSHVLIVISEEQGRIQKHKRTLEKSSHTYLIITSQGSLPLPRLSDPSNREIDTTSWLTELRSHCRGSFCTQDIFVIDLPHCYSKGIVVEIWNDDDDQ